MSQFMELCQRRQSSRGFSDMPVEHEKLEQIVGAARLAPSGCNAQPWSFIVVESPEAVAQVAEAGRQMGLNAFLQTAKAFVIILEEHATLVPVIRKILDSQYFAKGDIGAAAVSVCYAATELGLGTCNIGIYDREKIANAVGIPIEKQFGALIAVGYPADETIRPKVRKEISEVLRFV